MAFLRARWFRITLIVLALLVAAALLFVAAFPVGSLKGVAEDRLSARFGRPVTIRSIERQEAFSFHPTIIVRNVRVPQAAWAGTGDLANIGEIRTTLRALSLLRGSFSPSTILARDVRLDLVRDANGRRNWDKADSANTAGGDAPQLDGLRVENAVVRYRDAKRGRSFTVTVAADQAQGIRVAGTGLVRGAPVKVAASGPGIGDAYKPWPFRVAIDGAALTLHAQGTMDSPLNADHMALTVTAKADDLKLIDAIIEAGLFGTQPVTLSAKVRHDDPKWVITELKGTIGSSPLSGRLDVTKEDGRTKLDGDVRFARLDFADLADDRGQAAAAARLRAEGPKIVPPTRINIRKIDRTDGRIAFRIDRIASARGPTSLTGIRGVMTLDHQLLTVAPLAVGLTRGAITGRVVVDQRGERRVPTVTLALDMTGSSISALAGSGDVSGRLDARVRLAGIGSTLREAVGASDGSIGIVARDGALPAKMAAMLGFDAGRALTTDDDKRAVLRCAVVRLAVANGRGTFAPLIVDTSASQTRGTGGVSFPSEAIAATLTGAPKRDSVLRIPGSVTATGTIRDPQVVVPKEVKSVGNILKGIGRAITGKQGPTATDADCAGLSRRAIGR
ncbi:AsmA family protein [Sphingomonas donggukensis]|uniref:AsmA family protein n=1 Tax=Sphingomonas donggukensis TaxID=2949093 RepID=A0ABY4TX42_9SPHN|nr:AsmA family protein [Sphingomonas donggukensis]URW75724.1 AsmA family protein [Sphingomonas donggukensis]